MARTPDEARQWLEGPLKSGCLEVSLIGDVDLRVALPAVLSTFGALPNRAETRPARLNERMLQFPAAKGEKVFTYESDIPKAMAVVYWPTDDIWNISRTRRLNLLAAIITERLREQVREEKGEAYSPYAMPFASDTYKGYGYLAALVQASPANARNIVQMAQKIGADLRGKGVSSDELERARKPMLSHLKEWVRNNQYWLKNVMLCSHEQPQRFTWARTITDDVEAVTLEEINNLAKQYLAPEKAVKVLVLPKSNEPENKSAQKK